MRVRKLDNVSVMRSILLVLGMLISGSSWAQTALTYAGDLAATRAFMADLANLYSARGEGSMTVDLATSTDALVRAASGEVDMAGSARPARMTDRQERRAAMYPIVWDALVVIVNPENPIANISIEQLQQVYAGQINNWSQLNGADAAIDIVAHDDPMNGIDYNVAELLLGRPGDPLPAAQQATTMEQIESAVLANSQAMALVTYSSARTMQTKILRLDGVGASFSTIQSGDYLLYTPLYIGTRENGPNRREVRDFLRFAASAEAKRILRRNGVVPYADGLALISRQLDRADLLERLRTTSE